MRNNEVQGNVTDMPLGEIETGSELYDTVSIHGALLEINRALVGGHACNTIRYNMKQKSLGKVSVSKAPPTTPTATHTTAKTRPLNIAYGMAPKSLESREL